MPQPFIFLSCGQYTPKEKELGSAIVKIVTDVTGYDVFFAEEVHDLNGLDTNILRALHECAGFITVMHPRGNVPLPEGGKRIRASVWIEQEIAIATYIQRVEKRPLPVIAFIHNSVGREGLRDLLHLNPTEFANESEIIAALPQRLQAWKNLKVGGVSLNMRFNHREVREDHAIRKLVVELVNDTSQLIPEMNGQVRVPTGLFKHWNTQYHNEDRSLSHHRTRVFRFNQHTSSPSPIVPRSKSLLIGLDLCKQVRCQRNK